MLATPGPANSPPAPAVPPAPAAAAGPADPRSDAALEMLLAGASRDEVAAELFGGSVLTMLRHMKAAPAAVGELRELAAVQEHLRAQRIETLKDRALDQLWRLCTGDSDRERISIDELRARDGRRRACISLLRLPSYPAPSAARRSPKDTTVTTTTTDARNAPASQISRTMRGLGKHDHDLDRALREAAALEHEIRHLEGELIADRAPP